MDGTNKVFRSFQSPFYKCLVDDHLRGDVREFTSLPCLHLLSHGLEISLHPVDANRDAIDK